MSIDYTVIFDRETDGRIIASVPGVPGCHAYGNSTAEALRKVKSLLQYYVAETVKNGGRIPRQRGRLTAQITIAA